MNDCSYCRNILGIKNKIHGYGIHEKQADQLINDIKKLKLFEETMHHIWKIYNVYPHE